jgi:DNA-binding CsgD family transcriptional regulator
MNEGFPRVYVARPLTPRQREVLRLIVQFYRHTGETPSIYWIARRLGLHHSVAQEHVERLYQKGWLGSPSPAGMRCPHAP